MKNKFVSKKFKTNLNRNNYFSEKINRVKDSIVIGVLLLVIAVLIFLIIKKFNAPPLTYFVYPIP
jgi:hypothetical protein